MSSKNPFWRKWFARKAKVSETNGGDHHDTAQKTETILPDPFREKHKRSILKRMESKSEKEQQIAALQAGYFELVDLIRSISTHLDQQGQAQKQLLEALPKAISSFENVSKTTLEQNAALGLIHQEIQNNREQEGKLSDSLTGLSRALTDIDQVRRQQDDSFKLLFERSERRFHAVLALILLLMIPAIATPIYFAMRMQEPLPDPAATRAVEDAPGGPAVPLAPESAPASQITAPTAAVGDLSDVHGLRELPVPPADTTVGTQAPASPAAETWMDSEKADTDWNRGFADDLLSGRAGASETFDWRMVV